MYRSLSFQIFVLIFIVLLYFGLKAIGVQESEYLIPIMVILSVALGFEVKKVVT